MPQSSLREIEQTLTTLWMNRDARARFLAGKSASISPDLAKQIDRGGVELYAGLLNYGHHDVMNSIYPLSAKLLGKNWPAIVDDYLETFPPNHFNLNRTAKQFPGYVEQSLSEFTERFPFLCELADYEWVEMELLEVDEPIPHSQLESPQTPDQITSYGPIVNPALRVRHYQFPIISIAERIESSKRKPTKVKPAASRVIIYRDPKLNRCRFLDVGPVTASVIEAAQAAPKTYAELIALAVSMSPGRNPQQTIAEFLVHVDDLQSKNLFLGNKKLT